MFFVLLCANLNGQFEWQCTTPDNPNTTSLDFPEKGLCNTSSDWINSTAYIPADLDISPITIKVNFIFWQREDGIVGNFQENNPQHQAFINAVIEDMNHRVSHLRDPQNSACYGVIPPNYLEDSKIRFDIQKYYIADGFLWDIENATPNSSLNWYCPSQWGDTYTNLAYQRLAENNVRKGLNVFFANESGPFQQVIIDRLYDDDPSQAGGTTVACSELPGGQSNLGKLLRVEMTNSFMAYKYNLDINPNAGAPGTTEDQMKYSLSRGIVHELGHSFGLGHDFSCSENIMNNTGGAERNYLKANQLGVIQKAVHLRSIRQYVTCDDPGVKSRIIDGIYKWGFDTKIYTDVVLEPGAELTICGKVYMPKGGRIIVKRGAKLILDGGTISLKRDEYPDCPEERWGGILVAGNSKIRHADVDIDNLQVDDPGVFIMKGNAMIEYAVVGVNALNDFNVKPEDNYFIPVSDYSGGIVLVEGNIDANNIENDENNCRFKDCGYAVVFSDYTFENNSYFRNCQFISTDGNSLAGIWARGVQHIEVDNCDFRNLGNYGIGLTNAGAFVQNGCTFSEMTHGIYATAGYFGTGHIRVGSIDGNVRRNKFFKNTCGIYAFGVGDLTVRYNDFEACNFGVAVKGNTGLTSYDNNFDFLTIGERFEQSGNLIKRSSCNIYTNSTYGIYAQGANPGVVFDNNTFGANTELDPIAIDVMIQPKMTTSSTTLGSIHKFQGSENQAVFNLFSSSLMNVASTDIYAKVGETEQFFYYAPENPSDPRLIPGCGLNGSVVNCPELYNFIVNFTNGTPNGCLGLEEIICDTPDCLDEKYSYLLTLKNAMDGNDKTGLLDKLQKQYSESTTKQALLDASPYLSDDILEALVNSAVPEVDKVAILLANAPLSETIMNLVDGKIPSDDYVQLVNVKASNPISARDGLVQQIYRAEQAKNDVLFANINRLSLLNDHTAIQSLLEADGTMQSSNLLVSLKAKWGDIVEAQALLQAMPETTAEEMEAKQIASINVLRYANNPTGVIEFDDNQLVILYLIAQGQTPQAAYAMSLLSTYHGDVFVPELPDLGVGALNRPSSGEEQSIINPSFLAYPNPVGTTLHVNIPELPKDGLTISLYDLLGKEVEHISVGASGVQEINIQHLDSSVYLLSIQSKGNILHQQKISVIK